VSVVLGISAYYHDAAAAVVVDGQVLAAAEEERFTRKKHDSSLPVNAMAYCLKRLATEMPKRANQLDAVVFYDKPLTTFERLMDTIVHERRHGWRLFHHAMPSWSRTKLWVPLHIERALRKLGIRHPPKISFAEHHLSHAASAFYPSGFSEAAVLTIDGVGEWATTSVGHGVGSDLTLIRQLEYPNSLGLFYSAATSYCGFRVNSGEYKLMGLAPYGKPKYADRIRDQLIDLRGDGSFRMAREWFGFDRGESMTTPAWAELFDGPQREPESHLDSRIADVAASFQKVLEEAVVNLALSARRETNSTNLTMAGGVALNCVANRRIAREAGFDRVWIQPASSDAGGALGAALSFHWSKSGRDRIPTKPDSMQGSLLGPKFTMAEIGDYLDHHEAVAQSFDREDLDEIVAELLAQGQIVAVFRGRMEFGPRALGNRSILADPRLASIQRDLNLRTKMRESFRPFAPAVLGEYASDYFDLAGPSPYMLMVGDVRESHRLSPDSRPRSIAERVDQERSAFPAITHVDWSARVQTVSPDRHPEFHALISAFHRQTGCPIVVNTSFNIRGQPIVCTPEDAFRCFMTTGIDHLVIENYLLARADQPGASQVTLDSKLSVLD